jgi:hypothetical protein
MGIWSINQLRGQVLRSSKFLSGSLLGVLKLLLHQRLKRVSFGSQDRKRMLILYCLDEVYTK